MGQYQINVSTQLVTDQDPSNDALNKEVIVCPGLWTSGDSFPDYTYLGSGVGYSENDTSYLLSIGGNTISGLGTECYKYNVNTDTWTPIAPLPEGRTVLATTNVGDYIYAIGGSNMESIYQSTVYRYDIVGNSWTTVAPLPATLGWCKAVTYNNKIYVAGGYDGSSVLSTIYIYDVATDSWTTASSMPAARFGGAFSITGNKLVYVAGADIYNIYNNVFVGVIDSLNPSIISWTTMMNPYPGTGEESISEYGGNLLGLVAEVGEEKMNCWKRCPTHPGQCIDLTQHPGEWMES